MPTWETLEGWLRKEIEVRIQSIVEEEVTQFLGRGWYERKEAVDAGSGYRNGYGKLRRLSTSCGTIQIKRPRVRGLEERFESRILPLFARRTREVGELLPELYLHGLSQGDFELALRGLLGDGAPLSPSSIARLRGQWEVDYQTWQERRLDDRELVYAWADGIYVKAGLEKDKACLLVVIGAMSDGRKEVLGLVPGYRESTESWLAVLSTRVHKYGDVCCWSLASRYGALSAATLASREDFSNTPTRGERCVLVPFVIVFPNGST